MELALSPNTIQPPQCQNFRATNWEKFQQVLTTKLRSLPTPTEPKQSKEEAVEQLQQLDHAIQTVVDKVVLLIKISPYMKRWWFSELETDKKGLSKLANKAKRKRNDPTNLIHDQLRAERARFAKLIGKAKEDHWNEYLENIDANNI
jgi:hypothetical protein